MRGDVIGFFIIKQIKKASTVLCSVVKHLGSGRALKKWGKTLDVVLCFPLHFLLDFLKVLSNNSSLACWFGRWKVLFPLAARQILPVDFSSGDVNTH